MKETAAPGTWGLQQNKKNGMIIWRGMKSAMKNAKVNFKHKNVIKVTKSYCFQYVQV